MPFKDQLVVVTGGTRGIGAAIVSAFLGQGAEVVATYRGNHEAADRFAIAHKEFATKVHLKLCDVSHSGEVEALFEWIDSRFAKIDILINNAGIRRDAVLGMMSEADWDAVLDVNLKGTFLMSKYAVQRMSRQRYGRIVCVTSPSGELGFTGQGNYSASKAGQVGLMRSLAKEVAKRNITVNCVSPGFINTELLSDLKDDVREKYKNLVPLERFGTVEELSHAVLFLSSKEASYITGATLNVTGGL